MKFRIAIAALALAASARADVDFGMSASSDGDSSFYVQVGSYYHVPSEEVFLLHRRSLPDDELPVALFLATRAHVQPIVVLNQRLAGMSWMEISLQLGLDAGDFYWSVDEPLGPPYDDIFFRYRVPRNRWRRIHLMDADIINLVNLRFSCEHYGYRPIEVVRFRNEGHRFYQIRHRGHGTFVGARGGREGELVRGTRIGGARNGGSRIVGGRKAVRNKTHQDNGNHYGQQRGDQQEDDNGQHKDKGLHRGKRKH